VPFRASEHLGYHAPPLLVLLALIHLRAWKVNSAKFAKKVVINTAIE
jgi:hypothetical protein